MKFVKNDTGKLRWSLLPIKPIEEIIKVLMHGSKKYNDDNWMKCEDPIRYWDAGMRHLAEWKQGKHLDRESGYNHLAHAGCCIIFLLWFELQSMPTADKSVNTRTCDTCKHRGIHGLNKTDFIGENIEDGKIHIHTFSYYCKKTRGEINPGELCDGCDEYKAIHLG